MDSKLFHPLKALTHLDGRNSHKVDSLRNYFSEYAWMKARLLILLDYVEFLLEEKIILNSSIIPKLRKFRESLEKHFSIGDGEAIQEIERTTNHDLQAVIVFLQKKLSDSPAREVSPYVNLGLGSEDINNIALRQLLKSSYYVVLHEELVKLIQSLISLTDKYQKTMMLARTHGQAASVTTFGKEVALYIKRLADELVILDAVKFYPKLSGEVGNHISLSILLPKKNWIGLEKKFLRKLGFADFSPATQIPPYDDVIRFFDSLRRINRILIGLSQDMWLYASFGYLTFSNVKGEAGSSGMPHKINPQYFEGAEGGLEAAAAHLEFLSRQLATSRLQRDFSDSTVRRTISIPMALSLLSYQSLVTAFERLSMINTKISEDLLEHWEVLSETLTTALKLEGKSDAYSIVRERLRGKVLDQNGWKSLVTDLPLSSTRKNLLVSLSPEKLTGTTSFTTSTIIQQAKRYIKGKEKS